MSLIAFPTPSKQGRVEIAMARAARRKLRKSQEDTSAAVGMKAKQKEIRQSENFDMFSLAAIVLVVAVHVVPLTASTCK